MKAFFKRQWPNLLHIAGTAAVLLAPSVKEFALAHPGYSALIFWVYGKALHYAESPLPSNH